MKKTTLMLDESVYREIRKQAAQRGQSVSRIVAEALSLYLVQGEARAQKKIHLTVAEPGGWIGPVDPRSNSDLFDAMDVGAPTEQLR